MPEAAFNLFIAAGDKTKAGALADAHAQVLFEAGRREILLQWAIQLKDIALEFLASSSWSPTHTLTAGTSTWARRRPPLPKAV